jgi:phosphatidylglycerol lysyltransferase
VADDPELALVALGQYGSGSFSSCLLYDQFSRYWCQQVDGFVGYLAGPSMHVVIGEPVCAANDYAVAAREFSAFSRGLKADCLFAGVGRRFIDLVAGTEAMVVPVGDDLVFDVPTYAPRGDRAKKIRSAVNQLSRKGGHVVEYRRAASPDPCIDRALESLASSWMQRQEKPGLHFMGVELFQFAALKRYFYVELDGDIVGLATCLPIFARDGFLFEDVIRHPEAPAGVIEMLVLEAIGRFKAERRMMATFGPSLRPRVDGFRNLTLFDRAVLRVLIRVVSRLGKLPDHYHARKKFGLVEPEPVYLMMWPDDLTWRGLFNLLRLFHVL